MTYAEALAAYEFADAKVSAAYHAFQPIREGYHAGTVDIPTFCAARKVYDAEMAQYDAAYATLCNMDAPEDGHVAEVQSTLDMFASF